MTPPTALFSGGDVPAPVKLADGDREEAIVGQRLPGIVQRYAIGLDKLNTQVLAVKGQDLREHVASAVR